MPADLFLGLVTHPASRFPASAGDEGLARSLAAALQSRGLTSAVVIAAEDAWSPEVLPIDQETISRSIRGELAVEARWRLFQSPRTPAAAMSAFMTTRRLYRTRKFLPARRPVDDQHPGVRMIRRLVNIELSHLGLLRAARDEGARWALILEDDASGDPNVIAPVLAALIERQSSERSPLYVNVSRSFGEDRLRVEGQLTDIGGLPEDSSPTRILAARQPVTNTVCAVLYRGTFLHELVEALDRVPIDPVIPIDWKLNSALMDLYDKGAIDPGDCWTLRPAPIVQGSMHG